VREGGEKGMAGLDTIYHDGASTRMDVAGVEEEKGFYWPVLSIGLPSHANSSDDFIDFL
jgi:hypothetical protein